MAILATSSLAVANDANSFLLQEGDIVFSSSRHGQGEAIIAATASPYTHCGIVFEQDGKLMVLEAVQPVGVTTLGTFVSLSTPGTFTAKRLRNTVTPIALSKSPRLGQRTNRPQLRPPLPVG